MSSNDSPTIGITYFAEGGEPLKRKLFDRVCSWADLVLLSPEQTHPDLSEMGLDLYHMARWSWSAYADFERAADAGIPTINSYHGARITADRVKSAQAMLDHGLPFAEFEYGTDDEVTLTPPVIVKPRHELHDSGHEFRVVYSGDLDFDGARIVQRYIVPNRSFKLFSVGEHVRATEIVPGEEEPQEVPVSRYFDELVAEIATLFDLELFELDILVHKAYYIIDVNPVVSLAGVSDALDVYEGLFRSICDA
ncbi:Glutathione synthase/RimK-type ligase, ATP-grasp superfamily [Natronorubrum sediminis]|uniref:Glutathione synthase/RimK-type ligase, ATP-grasp superfamily n=1 Tax=Natronorubrum sediminis TaxID=640943 RepID=A0A1H6G711_9EURY|nr:hypothetical protein [Natronorubrum sediminis]SEH18123.1 Glutathione synthase/RimK-type ligase, ATP-grasp superfamily [Natronorubrum sediminis]